ncbi:MAG: HPr(Ser) kinase/phosphatase [Chloroflexota bacterium]
MRQFHNQQVISQNKAPVDVLLSSPVKLTALTGEIGLQNFIKDKNLHRPQLALAGYVGLFNYNRIQIFGNTENFYLKSLNNQDRIKAFKTITQFPLPCIILTNDLRLDDDLLQIAAEANIAVFTTPFDTTKAFSLLSEFLDDQFASQLVVHGSFVDVYGVGILFVGRSGIGKSEIALDLIERGHRLVADDVVMLTKKKETILMGTGTSLVQHFMEIRGLGIIDVRQMFGIRSIRFQKRLEIIVELEDWAQAGEYTRTGLDEMPMEIMGVEVSNVKLPIFPGKNITVIAEVIAINYLLRTYGYNAAKVFSDKLNDRIKSKGPNRTFQEQRLISYFQGDDE